MARRVYFAFHYKADIWRVNQVRQSWVTKESFQEAGFYDASLWEHERASGEDAIRRMIRDGLRGTTVTAFLLGERTAHRRWVQYELAQSLERGNGLLAIHIHRLADQFGEESPPGDNILDLYDMEYEDGTHARLSSVFETYDWVTDDGYENLGDWVEAAAQPAEE